MLDIVDWVTKMAMWLSCCKVIDWPELARRFCEHMMWKHGITNNIVPNRGTQFPRWFWIGVCSHMSTNHWLTTALQLQTKWPNWVAERGHGTVPPSLLQQWARRLGRTPSPGGIRVQQLSACVNKNNTILGHVPFEHWDAVQSTKCVKSKIEEPCRRYTQGIGRDAPDSPWKHTGSPAKQYNICRQKRNYVRCWRQSVAPNQALPANQAI